MFKKFSPQQTLLLKFILPLTIIAAAVGTYFYYQKANSTPFQNTVFFSLSAQSKTPGTSAYENLQAADQFTESVQGWFRDPGFLEKINSSSQENFALNARKQEKNNLLITFNSQTQEQGIKHANSISQTLQTAISTYSQNSDTNFYLALQNQNFSPQSVNLLFYILIGIFAGIIFPIALIWLYSEYFSAHK